MTILFNATDWFSFSSSVVESLRHEISHLSVNDFESDTIESIVERLTTKFTLTVPEIIAGEIYQSSPEDLPRRGQTKITLHVPFTGNQQYFMICPTRQSTNPPRGTLNNKQIGYEMIFTILPNADVIKSKFEKNLKDINRYLEWLENDFLSFNKNLKQVIYNHVVQRRQKLDDDNSLAVDLGYPIK